MMLTASHMNSTSVTKLILHTFAYIQIMQRKMLKIRYDKL